MTKIDRRKAALVNAAYAILIVGALYLFLKYAFWLFFPFIFGFFVAMILQRPINHVVEKTPIKKGLASGIFVLVFLAILIVLASLIGMRLLSEIKGLAMTVSGWVSDLPNLLTSLHERLLELTVKLPDTIEGSAREWLNTTFAQLMSTETVAEAGKASTDTSFWGGILSNFDFSTLKSPINGMLSTAKQIPGVLVAIIISIISCFFMTSGYDDIVNAIKRQLSRSKRIALSSAKGVFFSSLKKMGRAYATIIAITFVEMILGLNILRLIGVYSSGYIVAVSIITALVDIFPVLGTGTILIPWALYSLIMGHTGMGIGILIIYAVISVLRQVLEPKLVSANLGLPPILTIMGMYIGLQLFGFIGLFIMPIMLTVIKLLNDDGIIKLFKTEASEQAEREQEEADDEAV